VTADASDLDIPGLRECVVSGGNGSGRRLYHLVRADTGLPGHAVAIWAWEQDPRAVEILALAVVHREPR
jgi:hypothetical protein